jgi:hypothetical protein
MAVGVVLAVAATSVATLAYCYVTGPAPSVQQYLVVLRIVLFHVPIPVVMLGGGLGAVAFASARLSSILGGLLLITLSIASGALIGYLLSDPNHVPASRTVGLSAMSWGVFAGSAWAIGRRPVPAHRAA